MPIFLVDLTNNDPAIGLKKRKIMKDPLENLCEDGCTDANITLMKTVAQLGMRIIAESGHLPTIAVMRVPTEGEETKDSVIVIPAPMDAPPEFEEQQKDLFMEAVRYLAHEKDANGVAIVSECWQPPTDNTDEIQALFAKYGRISEMPGKREGILLMLNDKQQRVFASYAMERDNNGQISKIKLTKAEVGNHKTMSGRMFRSFYTAEDISRPDFAQRTELSKRLAQNMFGEMENLSGEKSSPFETNEKTQETPGYRYN